MNAYELTFADLLRAKDIDPRNVRLLRHYNNVGRTPYACWFNDRLAFERWQSYQKTSQRSHFGSPIWASFVAVPDGSTMFVGLYAAALSGPAPPVVPDYLRGGDVADASGYDEYRLTYLKALSDLGGRLFVACRQAATGVALAPVLVTTS